MPKGPYSAIHWCPDGEALEELSLSPAEFADLRAKLDRTEASPPDGKPDWVHSTPEMNYHLEAWGSESDEPEQKINLNFDEYTWLKQKLAIMRRHLNVNAE